MRIITDSGEKLKDLWSKFFTQSTTLLGSQIQPYENVIWRVLTDGAHSTSPEVLDDESLDDFWGQLIVVDSAPRSQFDAIKEALASGLKLCRPLACLAITGRGFHGQRGRPWACAPGNVHLTVALNAPFELSTVLPGLIMLPTVAIWEAISLEIQNGPKPTIKWINDVLLEGAKVGGALVAANSAAGKSQTLVFGLGVNVVSVPEMAPSIFVPKVGSMALHSAAISWECVAKRLLDRLAFWCQNLSRQGLNDLYALYKNNSIVLGRMVRIWDEDVDFLTTGESGPVALAEGIVAAIEPDLALRLVGHLKPIRSGRLQLI